MHTNSTCRYVRSTYTHEPLYLVHTHCYTHIKEKSSMDEILVSWVLYIWTYLEKLHFACFGISRVSKDKNGTFGIFHSQLYSTSIFAFPFLKYLKTPLLSLVYLIKKGRQQKLLTIIYNSFLLTKYISIGDNGNRDMRRKWNNGF